MSSFSDSFVGAGPSLVSFLVASSDASVSDNSIVFASSSVTFMTALSNAVLNFDAFSGLENRIASTSALASSSRMQIYLSSMV